MRWRILAIGKPKLPFAKAGVEEYFERLRPFAAAELQFLKAGSAEGESAALLQRSENCFRIVLDERGKQPTSLELAGLVSQWETGRHKEAALLVGGAEGHTDQLRESAGYLWSLSRLTLQHELALVVALEQIYRAYTIKEGLPYHRP